MDGQESSETPPWPGDNSSPPLSPKARAPSPPRWRFVADAKKTCGYSSKSAGDVVLGLSSDELAAKYSPPDVGSMAREIEQRQTGRLDIQEHDIRERNFEQRGVMSSGSNGKGQNDIDDTAHERIVTSSREHDLTSFYNDERDEENLTGQGTTTDIECETINLLRCGEEGGSQRGSVSEKVKDDFSSEAADNAAIYSYIQSPEESVHRSSASELPTNDQRTLSPEEQFPFSTKKGKRIAIAVLLVSLLVISIILGVVLSQNQDATPSNEDPGLSSANKELHASGLWDESSVLNATTAGPAPSLIGVTSNLFSHPTAASPSPSMNPSNSNIPTASLPPSDIPSLRPSSQPSFSPTHGPTRQPSTSPSTRPTLGPSLSPTKSPSMIPSVYGSSSPSITASDVPSIQPSPHPSDSPSSMPTVKPSSIPSITASAEPSTIPSASPSYSPSYFGSYQFVGRGACLDGMGNEYDSYYQIQYDIPEECGPICMKRDAFRGIVISHNYYCNCLYDDGFLPNPAPGQSSTSHSGSGEIVTSDGNTDARCYRYIVDGQ